MIPPDPATLSAAVATVREGFSRRNPQYHPACELLAREFVRLLDAGELVRKVKCEACGGDGFGYAPCERETLGDAPCGRCAGVGCSLESLIVEASP